MIFFSSLSRDSLYKQPQDVAWVSVARKLREMEMKMKKKIDHLLTALNYYEYYNCFLTFLIALHASCCFHHHVCSQMILFSQLFFGSWTMNLVGNRAICIPLLLGIRWDSTNSSHYHPHLKCWQTRKLHLNLN